MKPLEYYGAIIAGIQIHTKVIHVMKTSRILSLTFPLVLVGQSLAGSNPRTVIQSNYDKISKLSMTREKKKLEKLTKKNASSSFQYIDSMRNTLDLAATIRQNNEQLSRVYQFNSNSNKIIGIKEVGPDLICTVKTNYDVFLDSTKKNRITGTTISHDTWMKTLKGWKIRRSKIIKESSFMNGKPMR
jgi:hypothetical protein